MFCGSKDERTRQCASFNAHPRPTHLDCIDPIATNGPAFASLGNQGQVVTVEKANKANNAVGFDNGLESTATTPTEATGSLSVDPIPIIDHIDHIFDLLLRVNVGIFRDKVGERSKAFGVIVLEERAVDLDDAIGRIELVASDDVVTLVRIEELKAFQASDVGLQGWFLQYLLGETFLASSAPLADLFELLGNRRHR